MLHTDKQTDRQKTNKQTDKRQQKHNLLGGGNKGSETTIPWLQ